MTRTEVHARATEAIENVIKTGFPEVVLNDLGRQRPLAQIAIAGLKITPKVMAMISSGQTVAPAEIRDMLVEELRTS